MKILFINKYDTHGGAAIAGWRLLKTIKSDFNTDVKLLCASKKSNSEFVFETRKAGLENNIERGVNFALNQLGLQYVWFPFSTHKILELAKNFQPDIISLQNIHSGYFDLSLLPKLSKIAPLVWTLHDMWAFTASAAYVGNDESWKEMKPVNGERRKFPQIGVNAGKWLLKRKRRLYEKSDLTIVCPSNWLMDLAKQSPALKGKQIIQIANGVDLNCFSPPINKAKAKKNLNIQNDEKVILFYAQNLKDPRKGGMDLIKVLKHLDTPENNKVTLLIIGSGHLSINLNYLKLKEMGYLSGNQAIAQILQAADIFLFLSYEDNLPNTLIEVISCGIPCITYDAGGCGEIIKDNYNGQLVSIGDTSDFVTKLNGLLKNPKQLLRMQENARKFAIDHFDAHQSAKNYYNLFQKVIGKENLD